MPSVSAYISGKCRVIIDGDNINAKEVEQGHHSFSFNDTLELRDLTAAKNYAKPDSNPENRGQGGDSDA